MSTRGSGNGSGARDTIPPVPHSLQPGLPSNGNGPFRRSVQIINPLGLHQRAADRFCRAAKQFLCRVTVFNGDRRADGKNIWDLIGLLVFPGMEVEVEVEGLDAACAIDSLTAILGAEGGEDYSI